MLNPEFLITSLIVVLVPGTGVIYTISTGLFRGQKASIAAALGCTAGIIPHLMASILGLSFILHMSSIVFQGIKLVGVLYLIYLAWNMWRDADELAFNASPTERNAWQIAGKAILINLLNPKLTIFFFAFLPLFISSATSSPLTEMFMLSLVFMMMTLVVFIFYGILASSIRQYIIRSPKIVVWLQRSFALIFVGLGVKLALIEH